MLFIFILSQIYSLVTSAPTILYTLLDGTLGVDERGRIVVLPGAILHLDCLFQKSFGQPHWKVSDIHSSTISDNIKDHHQSKTNKQHEQTMDKR